MYKSLSFSWSDIISRTFSQVSWRVIAFLCFVHSDILYHLSCNCMQMIILCLHVILARLVHKSSCFVAVLWFFSFCQQNYSCWFVVIILSWDHDYWFQFMIQIQVLSLVCMLCRRASCQSICFLYCLQKISSKKIISFSHLENMSSTFINTISWSNSCSQSDHSSWDDAWLRVVLQFSILYIASFRI